MSGITTHVLDTSRGRPADRVGVVLARKDGDAWTEVGRGTTDSDGRCKDLAPTPFVAGVYRLTFETGAYFASNGVAAFHPRIAVEFGVSDPGQHHHVPVLVSPFGYTTYRGS
jgi:5-hydroxyisourate hydrolase